MLNVNTVPSYDKRNAYEMKMICFLILVHLENFYCDTITKKIFTVMPFLRKFLLWYDVLHPVTCVPANTAHISVCTFELWPTFFNIKIVFKTNVSFMYW
jgi:hypothetical protein